MRGIRSLACFLVVTVGGACIAPAVGYQGKTCDPAVGCPGGLVCNPFTATCGDSTDCPYIPDASTCSTHRYFYIAPNGSDSNNGLTPAAPRATTSQIVLQPGDDISLAPGLYGQSPTYPQITNDGTAACPIVIHGDPDGGTIVTQVVQTRADFITVQDVSFVTALCDVLAFQQKSDGGTATGDVLERAHFQDAPDAGACMDIYIANVNGAAVIASDFTATRTPIVAALASNVVVRGSRFVVDSGVPYLRLLGPGMQVEGNDFTGVLGTANLLVIPGGQVERNVFHDFVDASPDAGTVLVVTQAQSVVSNTFLNVGSRAVAADSPTFADNIVTHANTGGTQVPDGGTYNLFFDVLNAYERALPGPTDVNGQDPLLGADFVPGPGSPAIGAADPALPVPPGGGGTRADIGARQHGATLLPDGTYCLPP